MKINLDKALEELEAMRQLDSDEHVANALFTVAVARMERGHLEEAWEALDEAAYLCGKLDNEAGLAQVRVRLGELEAMRGNLGDAEENLRRALAFFSGADDAPASRHSELLFEDRFVGAIHSSHPLAGQVRCGEPVTAEQASIARQAYRDYGRGSGHPAGLNFGDCLSYALAKALDEELLFKGTDFTRTDIRPAHA